MLVKVTSSVAPKYASIAVIGGGIGGLTVANALLHRKDLVDRVSVYEQSPSFTPTDSLEYFQNNSIFRDHSVVNGPGTGEFIAFTVGSGDKKTFIWANTYASESPPKQQSNHDEEWSNKGNAEDLERSILPKFPEGHPIHDFAEMTVATGRSDDLLHFGLFYRQHKRVWTDDGGRVVLLGDSCRATLPYVGQGANQAMEDAIVLAECLEKHDDHARAYQEYYDRRFPRTKRIVQIAGIMHKLYHSESWFMHKALDYLLKSLVKGGGVLKQLEKEIIDENPINDFQKYIPSSPVE